VQLAQYHGVQHGAKSLVVFRPSLQRDWLASLDAWCTQLRPTSHGMVLQAYQCTAGTEAADQKLGLNGVNGVVESRYHNASCIQCSVKDLKRHTKC
jgi:hypothetical protein